MVRSGWKFFYDIFHAQFWPQWNQQLYSWLRTVSIDYLKEIDWCVQDNILLRKWMHMDSTKLIDKTIVVMAYIYSKIHKSFGQNNSNRHTSWKWQQTAFKSWATKVTVLKFCNHWLLFLKSEISSSTSAIYTRD